MDVSIHYDHKFSGDFAILLHKNGLSFLDVIWNKGVGSTDRVLYASHVLLSYSISMFDSSWAVEAGPNWQRVISLSHWHGKILNRHKTNFVFSKHHLSSYAFLSPLQICLVRCGITRLSTFFPSTSRTWFRVISHWSSFASPMRSVNSCYCPDSTL